jgi:diguanylate cyclase (GGDEF)-like protein
MDLGRNINHPRWPRAWPTPRGVPGVRRLVWSLVVVGASVLLVPATSSLDVAIRLGIFIALAIAIASISAYRRESHQKLERRLAARTLNLEAANEALNAQIAQRTELERRLEYLAEHDSLTDLHNRRRFEEALTEEVSRASRYRHGGAVLLIDLDHFKEVNDTLGHQAGDQLLKTIGAVLKGCVRQTDLVARLGGDEFGVLLRHVNGTQAAQVAESIVKATHHRQVAIGKRLISVTASVGVAMLNDAAASEVLANADFAMYDAKQSGRNGFAVHLPSSDVTRRCARPLTEFERLRHAIDNNRLTLYCQPIVDLRESTVTQYEVLLRMKGDQDEALSPSSFLSIAERLGLIAAIDAWVVKEAIELIAALDRVGQALTLNINISGKSVGDPLLMELIDRTLSETGVDPARLVFEVTETAAIANLEDAKAFAEQLRLRGCRFALDDFGTGFGSFYYLKHIPFDYLKIDGDFIQGFAGNATDTLVVEAIVKIAQGMGKKTVAEFVGSTEAAERLREMGVDFAQGYQLGVPQPVAQLFA